MKIMQINCVYKKGSTGKITYDIHSYLQKKGHESFVCYGRGGNVNEPNVYKTSGELYSKINNLLSRFTGIPYGGCFFSTKKLLRLIERERPDIVHLQCINGYFVNVYKLITYLKEKRIKTVLTLHAEFMHTANCGCSYGCEKWKTGCGNCPDVKNAVNSYLLDNTSVSFSRMKKAFKGFGDNLLIVGVSKWLRNQAMESQIMDNMRFSTIYNGIDISTFAPMNANNLKKTISIEVSQKVVLWVTSLFTYEKGKDYFIELSEMMDKNFKFIVVGADKPSDYKGDVLFLGKTENQKRLAEVYSLADVVICCSRQESYPTVSLEAQCCGTPFVGFDVGGVSETIREGMGETIKLGDLEAFKKAIEKWADKKRSISANQIAECRSYHSKERMCKEYLKIYEELL